MQRKITFLKHFFQHTLLSYNEAGIQILSSTHSLRLASLQPLAWKNNHEKH